MSCTVFHIQLVNDTVGTLMAYAYRHPETTMGVIMGTGTNAGNKKIWNYEKGTSAHMIPPLHSLLRKHQQYWQMERTCWYRRNGCQYGMGSF